MHAGGGQAGGERREKRYALSAILLLRAGLHLQTRLFTTANNRVLLRGRQSDASLYITSRVCSICRRYGGA